MNNPELSIIKLFLDYDQWCKHKDRVSVDDFDKQLQGVVRTLYAYHENNGRSITLDDLANIFFATNPKNREFFATLFSRLETLNASEDTTLELIKSLQRNRVLRELALDAYDCAQGSVSLDKVLASLRELDKQETVSPDSEADFSEFVVADLDSIANATYRSPGLRWRLDTLNKMFGSLRKGDFGFIFARPECFTPDTEVLTPDGWLSVAEVTLDTEISAVTPDLTLKFEKPALVTKRDDFDHVYHIYNRKLQMDIVVSPGHRMVYTKDNEWYEETAENIKYCQGKKSHTSTKGMGSVSILTPQERLGIAFQADGRARVYETHGYSEHRYGYEFTFTSERKIKRMRELLAQSPDVLATEWVDSKGYTGFYLKTNHAWDKDFSWVTLGDKSFVWCLEFAEELKLWDGSERSETRWKYSNGNKVAIDKAQAVVAMSGYNSFLSVVKDKRGYPDCYELHIRSDYTPVDGQHVIKEKLPNKESLYCFSVSTGMLLVRRNGKVLVCGNTGKTTFLASECTYMAEQLPDDAGPILWFNNEEEGKKVLLRCYQACIGATTTDLFRDIPGHQQEFMRRTRGKLLIRDSANITKREVESLCAKYKPSLIVFDQIDKIQGFQSDREDLRLGSIYLWARELAKKYCPTIGVSQADGTGEGVRWLTMQHVANAKTAKQAEADFILGIGKVHEPGFESIRFLHASKNKLLGDEDTLPELRHGHKQVLINPDIARYEDIP